MTLTVTPGSADADSFAALATIDDYCAAKGLTAWTSAPDSPPDAKEAAARRATTYLSTAFRWKGTKTNGRAQALAWPRLDVEDEEGEDVPSDTIPTEIVQACCEAAVAELTTPGYFAPAPNMTARVKRQMVAGAVEVEYFAAPMNAQAARPAVLLVRDLVAGLVSGSSNALVGTSVRA